MTLFNDLVQCILFSMYPKITCLRKNSSQNLISGAITRQVCWDANWNWNNPSFILMISHKDDRQFGSHPYSFSRYRFRIFSSWSFDAFHQSGLGQNGYSQCAGTVGLAVSIRKLFDHLQSVNARSFISQFTTAKLGNRGQIRPKIYTF